MRALDGAALDAAFARALVRQQQAGRRQVDAVALGFRVRLLPGHQRGAVAGPPVEHARVVTLRQGLEQDPVDAVRIGVGGYGGAPADLVGHAVEDVLGDAAGVLVERHVAEILRELQLRVEPQLRGRRGGGRGLELRGQRRALGLEQGEDAERGTVVLEPLQVAVRPAVELELGEPVEDGLGGAPVRRRPRSAGGFEGAFVGVMHLPDQRPLHVVARGAQEGVVAAEVAAFAHREGRGRRSSGIERLEGGVHLFGISSRSADSVTQRGAMSQCAPVRRPPGWYLLEAGASIP